MFTATFWKAAAERAAKSAAQALVGLWALDGFNALNADYRLAGGVAAGAALLSLVSSVASLPFGKRSSPSLADAA
jgi:hypothetical protein